MLLYSDKILTSDLVKIANELGIRLDRTAVFEGARKRRTRFCLRPCAGSDVRRLIRSDPYSASGSRRVNAVCWHGHFDFMAAVFALDPGAKIKSTMAVWDGHDDFHARAAASASRSIGSLVNPREYGEECHCA